MNKKLKRIVAVTVAISSLCAIEPLTNFNFMTTKAYAATGDLTRIKLKTSGGDTIKTYDDDDCKSKDEVDSDKLSANTTYYAKTKSKKIKIDTDGVDSKYVRIFRGDSSSTKGEKPDKTIELSKDSTKTITIRTYSEDPGDVKYEDKSKKINDYTIDVKCTSKSSSDDDDKDDDVYLKSISLSDGNIDFSKKTRDYDIKVAEAVSEIYITAKPDCDKDDYDDYDVTIDGTTVDNSDNFKRKVALKKGKNEIDIKVKDDNDNKRTYTLNITRAEAAAEVTNNATAATNNVANTATNNNSNTAATSVKINQWVQVGANWQFNDSLGHPIKNAWAPSNGKWYHLGWDGNMETNRWIYDANYGKYYYLYTDGSMATSTTIGGIYKVGADGAWIK